MVLITAFYVGKSLFHFKKLAAWKGTLKMSKFLGVPLEIRQFIYGNSLSREAPFLPAILCDIYQLWLFSIKIFTG